MRLLTSMWVARTWTISAVTAPISATRAPAIETNCSAVMRKGNHALSIGRGVPDKYEAPAGRPGPHRARETLQFPAGAAGWRWEVSQSSPPAPT
jgi:hypothetical protein